MSNKYTKLIDKELSHQIYYERYKTNEAYKLLKILDQADREIAERIKTTVGIFTKKRYQEVAKVIKQIASDARSSLENGIDVAGTIETEIEAQQKILKDIVDTSFLLPSSSQVAAAALFKPIVGTTFSDYLDSISSRLYTTWDTAVRTGYLTGQPTKDIVKSVLGSSQISQNLLDTGSIRPLRQSILANTRTTLQSFANEARTETFEKNTDLFSGYKWLATLDLRTCPVCGSFDGKIYTKLSDAPSIPLHMNCRCVLIPVIKGYEDLEYEGERAAIDGPVSGNITYEKWLINQSNDRQREILGPSRYEMYKNGYNIKDFVTDNRVLTLKELKNVD